METYQLNQLLHVRHACSLVQQIPSDDPFRLGLNAGFGARSTARLAGFGAFAFALGGGGTVVLVVGAVGDLVCSFEGVGLGFDGGSAVALCTARQPPLCYALEGVVGVPK